MCEDVRNEFVSPEEARAIYLVAVRASNDDWTVDEAKTGDLRRASQAIANGRDQS